MTPTRFDAIARRYRDLSIAVVGDFCLDRYLEIDADKQEISIETGLPVHNIINVRSQPGGAGTILNNLSALGIGMIYPVGFAGEDGEGWELSRALEKRDGVIIDHFFQTDARRTFTYTKPLIGKFVKPPRPARKLSRTKIAAARFRSKPGQPPKELNRLDLKNWTPTPAEVSERVNASLRKLSREVDAFILLSQVDKPGTGVLTKAVMDHIAQISASKPSIFIIADSRTGLGQFPSVCFKMNGSELSRSIGSNGPVDLKDIYEQARQLAKRHEHHVFVTLAECGIVGASPTGEVEHAPSLPVRGEIDIVGAGDSVTANITAAHLGGATLRETLEIANAGASVVIHQLGTTGTATVPQIRQLIS